MIFDMANGGSSGGDGVDEGVEDWINMKELKETYLLEFLKTSNRVLAVIDHGFSKKAWDKIGDKFGLEAAERITYWYVKDSGNPAMFIYQSSGGGNYSELDKHKSGHPKEYYRNNPPNHEASIVWLIKSIDPYINLLVIEHDGKTSSIKNALELIHNGKIYYGSSGDNCG
ncbi:MAG: hypothetical protein ACP6IP_08000 [Candidatus Njordarchaeia archaeon]